MKYGNAWAVVRNWRDRLLGALPWCLADALTKNLPRRTYDGIDLVLADSSRVYMAEQYFDRTVSALRVVAISTEEAYAGIKRDVRRIIFWQRDTGLPYHPFQQTIIVPPEVAQEPDITCLAVWLVHVSEVRKGESSNDWSAQFLASLPPQEALRVSGWLYETMRRAEHARTSYRPEE